MNILKLVGPIVIAASEILAIYAEVASAKSPTIRSVLWNFIPVTVAGIGLVSGYAITAHAYKSVWAASVASIGSVLVTEPIVILLVSGERPTTQALIGFLLGAAGMIVTLSENHA